MNHQSLNAIAEAACAYHEKGWQPVHVAHRSKAATMPGWPSLRPSVEELSDWFSAPANVGVALGEPSAWLVDVDLDCPETVELAPRFLPRTWIFGRASKPRSHYLYVAPGAVTRRFPGSGTPLVELRSTGGQTVFPPSVHESGEAIAWDFDEGADATTGPRDIAAADLKDRVVRLALAAMLVRAGVDKGAAVDRAQREQGIRPAPRPRQTKAGDSDVHHRARRYLAKMPPAIDGQGGHQATFAAALALVQGFGLDQGAALALLRDEYNPRCVPPWDERELQHKVADAARAARVPAGYLLEGGRHV